MTKKEEILKNTQLAEFLAELTGRITYWTGRNEDFVRAYLNLLFAFSAPNESNEEKG